MHMVSSYCPSAFFLFTVIEEANWLTLSEDVQKPEHGFDAVICLGNSFAHLPDFKGTAGHVSSGLQDFNLSSINTFLLSSHGSLKPQKCVACLNLQNLSLRQLFI